MLARLRETLRLGWRVLRRPSTHFSLGFLTLGGFIAGVATALLSGTMSPGDVIAVTYQTDSEELRKVFVQYGEALKKAVIAGEIKSSENDGETMEINGEQIKISIQKYKLQVTSFKLQDREEFCGNLETGNL